MRKHDKKARKENINKDAFIIVDSPTWRQPQHMDIGSLCDMLNNREDSSSNVFVIKFKDQDTNPDLPPDVHKLDNKLELAVDDNFLYVWVKNRWKRISLSSF